LVSMTALAFAEGEGNIIQPDGSLIFVLVLFIIFVFVLNRILFKPIGRVLDERETLTEGARTEARAAIRRYQAQLAEYEARIRQARGESYRLLEQQRAAALEERRRLIEQAKGEANQKIEQAKAEIAQQAEIARAALEVEARQIADQISRTVLGRTVGGGAD
jgi:F-type H+-transporting ATPase subunit b